ncbi:putative reverse transcriptase domain-containing protein [Tanacetum coccineum]|uniref:Reverse transcriptase domain-containing protein n=1 Tax=Tanacetum coccineum TaxID=301880 RepID=A0ABQ5B9K4_9ASTR
MTTPFTISPPISLSPPSAERRLTRCCFDLVEWSDKNLRSRAYAMTGKYSRKKDTDNIVPQKQPWSPATTLQEAECRQGLQYGDRRKEAVWGNLLPNSPSANLSPQWPSTQKCHKETKCSKGNGCFDVGAPGHFKRDCPKLKNKDGGNCKCKKAGCMHWGMQRREGIHRETWIPMLLRISAKKEEDKSEGKRIKDVPIVRDFLEVFPEDFLGLPPALPVEFQIDLISWSRTRSSSTLSIGSIPEMKNYQNNY